ncbi:MAG: glycerol-3-phosphate 1-O-acyltransferase PlsY, partial [Planctomycetia bacterium]|nr:glycerol-3-phosphate 1-O-acyltransferase PlsY [Planctomycetia bacterium]
MSPVLIASALVLAAYLIGAIPFGFLLAKGLKGVDVRTVGSGNIGATNVGRVLGFWFFWPVFLFDLAKGLLPTWGFPALAARLTGQPAPPDLAVLVAVAAILGHNFPVYLKFKGGKGVATSLGAVFALDPVAGAAAAAGFVVFLLVTRYVSLSSIGGGLVFFLAHFTRVAAPWSRGERALSVMTAALLVLLVVRHRKTLSRVRAVTD